MVESIEFVDLRKNDDRWNDGGQMIWFQDEFDLVANLGQDLIHVQRLVSIVEQIVAVRLANQSDCRIEFGSVCFVELRLLLLLLLLIVI